MGKLMSVVRIYVANIVFVQANADFFLENVIYDSHNDRKRELNEDSEPWDACFIFEYVLSSPITESGQSNAFR